MSYADSRSGAQFSLLPHDESHSERRQVGDVGKRLVSRRIEDRGQYRSKASENIKVIPLDHGADGGGENDSPNAVFGGTAHGDCVCTAGHASSYELQTWSDTSVGSGEPGP